MSEVRERQDGAGVKRIRGRGFERFDWRGGCDAFRRRMLPVRKERRQLRALDRGDGLTSYPTKVGARTFRFGEVCGRLWRGLAALA